MRIPLPVLTALAVLLASTSLGPLFSDPGWILPTMGAIVVAVLMGVLARSLPLSGVLRAIVGLGLSVAGFLCFITAVLASETGILGVVPGTGTPAALRALSDQATSDIHDLLVPIPAAHGVVLFVVAGCYFTAAVTDLLVSGFRRPALAGFPLLILFAVPAGLARDGAGWFAFIATSAGYLILLHADGRAAIWRWGHPVRGSARQPDQLEDTAGAQSTVGGRSSNRWLPASAATGRRIGAVSIAGALVLPALIPIGTSTWLSSTRRNAGRTVTVPPMVDISTRLHQSTETDVLHVTTTSPQYLRMTALDLFTGTGFDYVKQEVGTQNVRDRLPTTLPEEVTRPASGQITATSALRERFLPLPYEPDWVHIDGNWRFAPGTGTVFSTSSDTGSETWAYEARVPDPTRQQLTDSGRPTGDGHDVDLALPDNLDPRITARAVQLGEAGPTAYAKAVAIQAFLRSDQFTYDLNDAPIGRNALSDFLFDSHTGFCQQFATAMAVLARANGIPARVAIGFTAGRPSGAESYTVTSADAHAWPELYFHGLGWVPFEPTPRGDGQAVEPAYSTLPQGSVTPGGPTAPDPGQGTDPIAPKPGADSNRNGSSGANAQGTTAADSGSSWWWFAPAATVALILLFLVPVSARSRVRRRRQQRSQAGHGEVDWQELIDTATDLGIRPDASQSPRRVGQQLASRLDEATAETLEQLALAEERRRYAAVQEVPAAGSTEFSEVSSVSAGLRRSVSRRTRMRALFLPRSWFRRQATTIRRVVTKVRPSPVSSPSPVAGRKVGPAGG
jgi:transglutaminase-like putative cysteine protease